jgi:23S rRNA U2552 (ribose-2'-O)-methylase RlmE/FtsJ
MKLDISPVKEEPEVKLFDMDKAQKIIENMSHFEKVNYFRQTLKLGTNKEIFVIGKTRSRSNSTTS